MIIKGQFQMVVNQRSLFIWAATAALIVRCQEATPNDPLFLTQPGPPVLNVTIDSRVDYYCRPQPDAGAASICWQIDGTQQDRPLYHVSNDVSGGYYNVSIPIQNVNDTTTLTVRCIILYDDNQTSNSSRLVTINIQGQLDQVSDLRGDMLDSDGQSFNVTWTAPPTLDITNTEPDISYHVDVLKIDPTTGSSEKLNISWDYDDGYLALYQYAELEITTNNSSAPKVVAKLNVTAGGVTPCDVLSVTVTPYNGVHQNISGTPNTITVYPYRGPRNFQHSDVNITATELDQDRLTMSFNITLNNIDALICRSNCSINVSQATQAVQSNHSIGGLVCEGNMLSFNVTNSSSPLSLRELYTITAIEVGNSDGKGSLTADNHTLTLSTHAIQSVRLTPEQEVEITFARNTSLWGAHVALTPEVLTDESCNHYTRRNYQKPTESNVIITERLEGMTEGTYNGYLHVYGIGSTKLPDKDAVLVNRPENLTLNGGTTAKLSGPVRASRERETEIKITYPQGRSYFVLIEAGTDSSGYTLVELGTNESSKIVQAETGTNYCLSVFEQYSNGTISPGPINNIYISYAKNSGENHLHIIGIGLLASCTMLTN